MKPIENPLSKIVEESSTEVFVVDAETLKFLYVNQAVKRNLGYTLEELSEMTTKDISDQAKPKETLQALFDTAENKSKEKPECILISRHKPKNSPSYPVELHLQLTTYNGKRAFVAFAQKIPLNQKKLFQLNADIESASISYWDWNIQNGHYEVNDRGLGMLGFKPEPNGYSMEKWLDRIHLEDRGVGKKAIEKCLKDGLPYVIEFRMQHIAGHYIWIQGTGSIVERDPTSNEPIRLYGTLLDISKRKQDELEKYKGEQKYRALAENSEDLIIQFDRNLRHLYVNPAVLKFRALPPHEYLGKTHKEIGFPAHLCEFWGKAIKRVFESGEASFEYFETVSLKGTIYIDWRLFPEFNQDGKVETVFSVSRDITKFKQVEEETQKIQKLKSLGVLAGGIAHDFNNILTILFGNLSMAKSSLSNDHPSFKNIEKAEQAFNRATNLTGQLLTFAQGGDPIKEKISISQLVEDVTSFDLSGSNVKLEFEPPDDLWMAEVDKGQMEQVFSNLTVNANQAMEDGGHLYIGAENIENGQGEVSSLKPGKYIKFTVRDEGEGIEPDSINRIFDPYYSTKLTGAGLGLATVYSIINKHGGHINVSSKLKRGTVFTFYIPASIPSNEQSSHVTQVESPKINKLSRVLVMDDEEMIRMLATEMLKQAGYEAETANDGRQAIEMYKQSLADSAPYDCIIMDLTIPGGMGGAKAIQEILKLDSSAKAIVASGYAADSVMGHYQNSGFKGALAKPFSMTELKEEVARVIGASTPEKPDTPHKSPENQSTADL